MSLLKSLKQASLDLFFPPLCKECTVRCRTKYLCSLCWEHCAPIEPLGRCRHCFTPLETLCDLCHDCRKGKTGDLIKAHVFDELSPAYNLPRQETQEALASFAYIEWLQLEWDFPDLVLSNSPIGVHLANLLEVPFSPIDIPKDAIEDHLTLLIFSESLKALVEEFQEFKYFGKIYALSLFHS